MTVTTALTLAAAVTLPGVAYMAGATALRTWKMARRRRGPWCISDVRGMAARDARG